MKNKVIEIQNLVAGGNWMHISTKENKAADLLSKGCKRVELEKIIEGLAILYKPLKNPEYHLPKDEASESYVQIDSYHIAAIKPIMDTGSMGKWKRLLRVTSYVQRFIRNCKRPRADVDNDMVFHYSTRKELGDAEDYWIRQTQADLKIGDPKFENLAPFIDPKGIIRARGRIEESEIFNYDQKHPIILPGEGEIAKLILRELHDELFHPGYSRVVAESRKRYWILNARSIAKSIG